MIAWDPRPDQISKRGGKTVFTDLVIIYLFSDLVIIPGCRASSLPVFIVTLIKPCKDNL